MEPSVYGATFPVLVGDGVVHPFTNSSPGFHSMRPRGAAMFTYGQILPASGVAQVQIHER
jgi:hypothetical protein